MKLKAKTSLSLRITLAVSSKNVSYDKIQSNQPAHPGSQIRVFPIVCKDALDPWLFTVHIARVLIRLCRCTD